MMGVVIKGFLTENIDSGTMCLSQTNVSTVYGVYESKNNLNSAYAVPNTAIVDDTADFDVADIPKVMEKLEWKKAAAVMTKWFSLPAKKMTTKEKDGSILMTSYPVKYIDKTIFSMEWIRGFSRGRDGFSTLKATLSTANAKKIIKKRLSENISTMGFDRSAIISNPLDPLKLHSYWQFQYADISYEWTVGMDDLYAALGTFALYASILEGYYTVENNVIKNIHISKVGIYMKDTFDFIGMQYLGHWNESGMAIEPIQASANKEWSWNPAWNYSIGWANPVGNSDYREYRTRTGRGGDLLLFSDVVTVETDISL